MQHDEIIGYRASLEEKMGGGGVDVKAAEVPRDMDKTPVWYLIVSYLLGKTRVISEYEMVQRTSIYTWDTFHPHSLICIFAYVLLVHQLRLRPGEPTWRSGEAGVL